MRAMPLPRVFITRAYNASTLRTERGEQRAALLDAQRVALLDVGELRAQLLDLLADLVIRLTRGRVGVLQLDRSRSRSPPSRPGSRPRPRRCAPSASRSRAAASCIPCWSSRPPTAPGTCRASRRGPAPRPRARGAPSRRPRGARAPARRRRARRRRGPRAAAIACGRRTRSRSSARTAASVSASCNRLGFEASIAAKLSRRSAPVNRFD